jgi:predicted amidophosphoribosyltransferase
MLRAAASLIAPPLCALCADPCDYVDSICRMCERRVDRLHPVRDEIGGLEIWSASKYEGVAQEIVAKMKFAKRLTLAEVAAERMLRTVGAGRELYCVPVPPSPARERARGFDLAYALSRLITREGWGQTILCLERDDGPRQVGRGRVERKNDPPTVRPINASVPLLSDDVWLVDDVATTGSTLLACADALRREQGAKRVRALTFARADN